MKQQFRSWLIRARRFLYSTFSRQTGWYYRQVWSPKAGTLEEALDAFARRVRDPFVVQVGANDGFQNDPIFKFVKAYDWRGICLEPQPLAFAQLETLYRQNKMTPVQIAIAPSIGVLPLYKLSFTTQRWATGLSSFNRSHLEAQINSGYVATKARKYKVLLPADQQEWIDQIEVATTDFQTLLDKHQATQVDFLHIDTEGFDAEVFRLFPFDSFMPSLILIEIAHLSPDDIQEIEEKLTSMGYQSQRFGVDLLAQKG